MSLRLSCDVIVAGGGAVRFGNHGMVQTITEDADLSPFTWTVGGSKRLSRSWGYASAFPLHTTLQPTSLTPETPKV
jgi:hypothetical protein